MATVNRFEDLEIWKKSRVLCQKIWSITNRDPFSKDFELKNQINAASGSVMDNIAAGFERSGNKEFIHFLLIAKAYNGEVRSQLYRMNDRKYLVLEKYEGLKSKNETLSKKITSFIKYLKESEKKGFRYE